MSMSWKIGGVSITAFVESSAAYPLQALLPDATVETVGMIDWIGAPYVTSDKDIVLAVQGFGIESKGRRIIVDTCNGNDKQRPSGFGHMQQSDLLDRMAEAGFGRGAVDIVLCTHLHADHVGWNTMLEDGEWRPTFPNARYLVGRTEFEHAKGNGGLAGYEHLDDSVVPIVNAGLIELVDPGHRITDEVSLVSSPGHTPGHVSVMIASDGSQAMITGDFLHSPIQIARPEWSLSFDYDPDLARATRSRLIRQLTDQSILVLGSHFPHPTAGYIVETNGGLVFDDQV